MVGTYLVHPYQGYTTGPSASDRFVLQSATNVGFFTALPLACCVCDKARTEVVDAAVRLGASGDGTYTNIPNPCD